MRERKTRKHKHYWIDITSVPDNEINELITKLELLQCDVYTNYEMFNGIVFTELSVYTDIQSVDDFYKTSKLPKEKYKITEA